MIPNLEDVGSRMIAGLVDFLDKHGLVIARPTDVTGPCKPCEATGIAEEGQACDACGGWAKNEGVVLKIVSVDELLVLAEADVIARREAATARATLGWRFTAGEHDGVKHLLNQVYAERCPIHNLNMTCLPAPDDKWNVLLQMGDRLRANREPGIGDPSTDEFLLMLEYEQLRESTQVCPHPDCRESLFTTVENAASEPFVLYFASFDPDDVIELAVSAGMPAQ